jgi:hypothetical protein
LRPARGADNASPIPLPAHTQIGAIVIAGGIALAMYNSKVPATHARDAAQHVKSAAHDAKEAVGDSLKRATDAALGAAQRAGDATSSAARDAAGAVNRAVDKTAMAAADATDRARIRARHGGWTTDSSLAGVKASDLE